MIYVGTGDTQITETLMGILLEAPDSTLTSTYARFFALGLGLLYLGNRVICFFLYLLGKGDASDVALEMAKALKGSLSSYTALTISTCAYAGTGNVLKVQLAKL